MSDADMLDVLQTLAPPEEVVQRAQREREFFNRHTDPAAVPDEFLRDPNVSAAIPDEVAEYMPDLRGKRICEIGCGYGLVCCHFAHRGAQVWGVDVSENNIAIAKRAARLNGVEHSVSFAPVQAECLGFADNTFDLVFGNAVLHHLDIKVSAREIYRVLKPGGVAIFREPFGENRLLEWARNSSLRSGGHRHTADEHSLLYKDVNVVRTVFPKVVFRESELLSVFTYFLRKAEVGMIAVPRWDQAAERLKRIDRWLLTKLPLLRTLASYSVISMFKPASLTLIMNGEKSA